MLAINYYFVKCADRLNRKINGVTRPCCLPCFNRADLGLLMAPVHGLLRMKNLVKCQGPPLTCQLCGCSDLSVSTHYLVFVLQYNVMFYRLPGICFVVKCRVPPPTCWLCLSKMTWSTHYQVYVLQQNFMVHHYLVFVLQKNTRVYPLPRHKKTAPSRRVPVSSPT